MNAPNKLEFLSPAVLVKYLSVRPEPKLVEPHQVLPSRLAWYGIHKTSFSL